MALILMPELHMRHFSDRLWRLPLAFLPVAAAMLVALCAATPVPRFDAFPPDAVWNGKTAPVVLATPADRLFRTRLRETATAPANFAGHYSVGLWGCGTECVSGAAVDLHTGHVIWLPGTICCYMSGQANLPDDFEPVLFRADSRLIELSGQINEAGTLATHTYVLQGGRFVHLADRPLATQAATPTHK